MIYAETDRLYLRQLAEDDLPRLGELIGDWEVVQWVTRAPHPYTLNDAKDWLAIQNQYYDANKPEFFAIADKTNNRFLGGVGLHPSFLATQRHSSAMELGYWLGQPYWGKGLMSEAVTEAVKYGFGQFSASQLLSTTDAANHRSQNVLRKAGFTQAGTAPRDPDALRGPESMLLWRLTREDYQASMGITLEPPRS